jgi:hypothetical protein
MASFILSGRPIIPQNVFDSVSFYRNFYAGRKEALK